MSLTALVAGNGESRRNIDIDKIDHDISLGCNAIHRDRRVDHLICCDRRMLIEAIDNPDNVQTKLYGREEHYKYFRKAQKYRNVFPLPLLPFKIENKSDDPKHWNSGPYAVFISSTLDHVSKIIMIGFDLYSQDEKINNLYKDTKNYSKKTQQAVDPNYWIIQIGKVFNRFPHIEYVIINNAQWKMPYQWNYSNVRFQPL
jgi:hypothetical protein